MREDRLNEIRRKLFLIIDRPDILRNEYSMKDEIIPVFEEVKEFFPWDKLITNHLFEDIDFIDAFKDYIDWSSFTSYRIIRHEDSEFVKDVFERFEDYFDWNQIGYSGYFTLFDGFYEKYGRKINWSGSLTNYLFVHMPVDFVEDFILKEFPDLFVRVVLLRNNKDGETSRLFRENIDLFMEYGRDDLSSVPTEYFTEEIIRERIPREEYKKLHNIMGFDFSKEFIRENVDYLDFSVFSFSNPNIDEDFMEEFIDKIDSNFLAFFLTGDITKEQASDEFFIRNKDKIAWNNVGNSFLSKRKELFEYIADDINWTYLDYSLFDDSFLVKYIDKIDFENLVKYGKRKEDHEWDDILKLKLVLNGLL